ncbi:DUF3466 family protein [Actinokineospora enzanensis]|uniref:DUF3466 family protein n=1 Tax=Actinokineospora enzanensis TaxID=155975 RepID=UPI00036C24E4|nr:DUF3466 family protein [Actinokineospora enzanensis]
MRKRLSAAALAAAAAITVPGTADAATPQYRLVLGAASTSEYLGIDARGDIFGIGVQASAQGRLEGIVVKAGTTTPVFLGTPGDQTNQHSHNRPRAINNQGVVVGNYQKVIVFPGGEAEIPRPTSWPGPDNTGTDIGVNPTGDADAFAINNLGQIVGTQAGSTVTPWSRQGTTVTTLPSFPGADVTEALAVNDNGLIVGDAVQAGRGPTSAVQWVNGTISSLGGLGGTFAEALAVNNAGQVVGSACLPGDPINFAHAVRFADGTAIDLNVPGAGKGAASAHAINSSGVIVGEDGIDPDLVSSGNGFVYRDGRATELNTLIAPTRNVRLASANGINDAGIIVGIAVVTAADGTQDSVGYELVPIPPR